MQNKLKLIAVNYEKSEIICLSIFNTCFFLKSWLGGGQQEPQAAAGGRRQDDILDKLSVQCRATGDNLG